MFIFLLPFVFGGTSSLAEETTPDSGLLSQDPQEKDSGEPEGELEADREEMEKMSVLGSRIRRLDMEGPSPVHVITREEIEKSGHNTVGRVLRDSTVASFGGSTSTINVRGMGAENTLVLVNGRRLPKQGSFYGNRASDVNAVPASAVERIEVLTDGASAVYGSEALSSVINIVTRKDLSGTTTNVKMDITGPAGGETLNTSVTYGQVLSNGHFNTSFEYLHGTPLYTKDLDYINPIRLRRSIFSDNYYTSSRPNQALSNCATEDIHEETGECRQYHGDINRSGGRYVFSNFSEVSYKFRSDLVFTADAMIRYSNSSGYSPPYARVTFAPGEELPAWALNEEGVEAGGLFVMTHRMPGIENKDIDDVYTLGANWGLEGELDYEDWVWSLVHHTANYKTSTTYEKMVLIDEFKQAMVDGSYHPFDRSAQNTAGVFLSPTSTTNYLVSTLDFSADGTVAEMGHTTFSGAAGLQLGYHEYKEGSNERVRNGEVAGLRGIEGAGKRSQQSAYVELGAMYSDWLEAQLATRYDNYSDFGSTINPKLAFRAQPLDWLMVRSSVGTGFKAPELADVNGGLVEGWLQVIDWPQCKENPDENRYCDERYYRVETGGNPDLQEETSFSYNVGIGIQPTSELSFSIDYWNYRVEDVVGVGVNDILKMQARQGISPEDHGIQIIRDENGDPDIDKIIAPQINLGILETDGLDFKAHWSWGPHTLSADYSVVFNRRTANFEALGFETILGDYGVPRYRYMVNLDYALPGEEYNFQLKSRTSGDYRTRNEQGKIPETHPIRPVRQVEQGPF